MYFGGANLYEENGLYYLVGEGEKVGGISGCFNFYRSPDLSTWTNLGCLLNISDIIVPPPFDNSTFRRGFGHGLRMERPKIFKCPTAAAGTAVPTSARTVLSANVSSSLSVSSPARRLR